LQENEQVIFTYEGNTLVKAIEKYFQESKRFICGWHVANNFKCHISSKKVSKLVSKLPFAKDFESVANILEINKI
jgi:uncharacterized protein YrrD